MSRQIKKQGPLKIITLGHPTLRQKARPLSVEEIKSSEVQKFIADFVQTLRNSGYGAALAGNQVDKLWQIIVMELNKMPLQVLINPVVVKFSEETDEGYEGCLSVPNYLGVVERSSKIVVEALNEKCEPIKIKAGGFRSRVLQHEIDHLHGIMYLDRMKDFSTLMTEEEFDRQFNHEDVEVA